jgi:hypothetical protein
VREVKQNLGMLLLGAWLILTGLIALGLHFQGFPIVMAILAIAAGVLILARSIACGALSVRVSPPNTLAKPADGTFSG